jgi:hypothetical protein
VSATESTGTAVLDRLRELERQKQAIDVEELALVAQIETEGLAFDLGAKNTAVVLRDALHISARDAAARVKLAAAVMPRRLITGETVEPKHPQTAQALADGVISTRHAATVVAMTDRIDDILADQSAPLYETALLDFARDHDPDLLARFANGLYARVDQDGAFGDIERAHRRRTLTLRRRPDGSATLAGELTCEAAEYVQTLLDTLAKPHLDAKGRPDSRTPAQRRHDAILEALKLLYSSGSLPTANGCATTLVLTATIDEFADGTGIVQTSRGYAIPTAVADRWLDPKAKAILVLLSKTRSILAYSDQHRLFTEQQRLAMFARDRGCSYPGCDARCRGRRRITSPISRLLEERASTTAPLCARPTTPPSNRWDGSRSCSMKSHTGCRRPGSTPTSDHAAIGCTTSPNPSLAEACLPAPPRLPARTPGRNFVPTGPDKPHSPAAELTPRCAFRL